jgi:hypothetical protein
MIFKKNYADTLFYQTLLLNFSPFLNNSKFGSFHINWAIKYLNGKEENRLQVNNWVDKTKSEMKRLIEKNDPANHE